MDGSFIILIIIPEKIAAIYLRMCGPDNFKEMETQLNKKELKITQTF